MRSADRLVKSSLVRAVMVAIVAVAVFQATASAWWEKEWTIRKKITVDTVGINEPIGSAAVLLRLHDGNFQFASAKDDGTDIRCVSADDKTLLPFHIERYDSQLNEGFVWVKLADIKPGVQTTFWLYYGNSSEKAVRVDDPKGTYDDETVLAYHFSESNAAPNDSSGGNNKADTAGVSAPGALIGGGLRLSAQTGVTIPTSPSLAWADAGPLTWSAWVKPTALGANAVLFSRRDASHSFVIGINEGVPYVEVGTERSPAGAALVANAWRHLAVLVNGAKIVLYLDGESYATLNASLPALATPMKIGKPSGTDAGEIGSGFTGEIDDLLISKVARPTGYLKLLAINQGVGENAGKLLAVGNDEASEHRGGESEIAKHLTLIKDISKDLTIDGWIVIGLCTLLAIVGWIVTALKFAYLNRIKKATAVFLKQWEHLSADLSVLDHGNEESIKSMGGNANGKIQKILRQSPLYHIYQIGFSEIQHRVVNAREGFKGLSGRSMQSIKATLDGGLIREVQRLNSNLVFLTIGIAGGPYLGLLGTVIGVMITFAVIAKSGAVEVNSIAPGIAGALLATVAGLAVAIPALFAYSYISSRIKDAISEMQIFIDEFVAKIAEAFPTQNE